MGISPVAGFAGFNNYKISSINGNPYSMNAVHRVEYDAKRSGKPLIIASEEPKEDLYVKEFGSLETPKSTATGDFAEMLTIQKSMLENETNEQRQSAYTAYLNDTIGMMGLQNKLRDQLNGAGFIPF